MFDIGKIPPSDPEIESNVLGIIINDATKHLPIGLKYLRKEDFYTDSNREIFSAILAMDADKQAIDMLTVISKLRSLGKLDLVGGAYALTTITNKAFGYNLSQFEEHCKILVQLSASRAMITLAQTTAGTMYSENNVDPFKEAALLQSKLNDIINRTNVATSTILFKTYAPEFIRYLETPENDGILSGNTGLDRRVAGWRSPEFTIICGRPGHGKSARALQYAKASAQQGKKTLYISLEMLKKQLVSRLVSSEGYVEGSKFRHKDLSTDDWTKVNNAIGTLYEIPLYMNDKSGITVEEIRAISMSMKSQQGLDIVFVDYLQLVRTQQKLGNREQEIGYISRSLKEMASELDIPVIALAQVSREPDKRANKRPGLSDLRESGTLEQDADNVFACYIPSKFYSYENDPDVISGFLEKEGVDKDNYQNYSELIPLKMREGGINWTLRDWFIGRYSRFNEGNKNEGNHNFRGSIGDNEPF